MGFAKECLKSGIKQDGVKVRTDIDTEAVSKSLPLGLGGLCQDSYKVSKVLEDVDWVVPQTDTHARDGISLEAYQRLFRRTETPSARR